MFDFRKTFSDLLIGFKYNSKKKIFYKMLEDNLGIIVIDMQKSMWAREFCINIRLLPMFQTAVGYCSLFNLVEYFDKEVTNTSEEPPLSLICNNLSIENGGILSSEELDSKDLTEIFGNHNNKTLWWSLEDENSGKRVKDAFILNYDRINEINNLKELLLTIRHFSKTTRMDRGIDDDKIMGNEFDIACAYAKIGDFNEGITRIGYYLASFPTDEEGKLIYQYLINSNYEKLNEYLEAFKNKTRIEIEKKYLKV